MSNLIFKTMRTIAEYTYEVVRAHKPTNNQPDFKKAMEVINAVVNSIDRTQPYWRQRMAMSVYHSAKKIIRYYTLNWAWRWANNCDKKRPYVNQDNFVISDKDRCGIHDRHWTGD